MREASGNRRPPSRDEAPAVRTHRLHPPGRWLLRVDWPGRSAALRGRSRMENKLLVRLSWVFLLVGLGLLGGAGYAASRVAAFVRGAATAEGTVVELVSS